jgi:hypothetical protein
VFFSRYETDTAKMGFLGNMRFTIYDILDDTAGGSEIRLLWDNRYKFDPKL